ncbi:GNAT family N-acetyltransferase [Burkholderia territorii]|uniref:GNAT family N-acetyltransferase n=1 Tax=Burkholderia territorii TaxID=1503055 RepID=UPI00075E7C3A|nr:N-acetyltransferase [Burkholderia territorii]KWA00135.1 GCN5 family acetyltransferase [Burkholderia territorii]
MTSNMTTVDIRAATSVDAPAIADIHVASWRATYPGIVPASYLDGLSVEQRATVWREVLDAGQSRVALAFTEGELRGWINYGPTRDTDKDSTWGEIGAIYLHPSHCGRGIGAALVAHARRSLHDAGHEWVSLWVLVENNRAKAFYEREGFVAERDTKTFEIDGVPIEEIRYWRALP